MVSHPVGACPDYTMLTIVVLVMDPCSWTIYTRFMACFLYHALFLRGMNVIHNSGWRNGLVDVGVGGILIHLFSVIPPHHVIHLTLVDMDLGVILVMTDSLSESFICVSVS